MGLRITFGSPKPGRSTGGGGTSEPEPSLLPIAARYRRRQLTFIKTAGLGIVFAFLAAVVPDRYAIWVGVPAIALIAFGLVIFFTQPALDCPECGKSLENFGEHCPSCGEPGLDVNKWKGTRCNSCKKHLGTYKGRTYRIRFCTHCGVLLDGRGV